MRKVVNFTILGLILLGSAMVFAETLPQLPCELKKVLKEIRPVNLLIPVIFIVEYVLRLWTADLLYKEDQEKYREKYPDRGEAYRRFRSRWKYFWSPIAIIDLAAILSFLIPLRFPGVFPEGSKIALAIRFVVILRLFRYATRYPDVMRKMSLALYEKRRYLQVSLAFILILMLAASVLMYAAESSVQPEEFTSGLSGLWWAVTTVTTLGYGDLSPVTFWGRLCGGIIALAGVAAFAVPTAIISSALVKDELTTEKLKKILADNMKQQKAVMDMQAVMIADLSTRLRELKTIQSNQFQEFDRRQREAEQRQKVAFESQQHRMDRFMDSQRELFARLEEALADAQDRNREADDATMKGLHQLEDKIKDVKDALPPKPTEKPTEKKGSIVRWVKSVFHKS